MQALLRVRELLVLKRVRFTCLGDTAKITYRFHDEAERDAVCPRHLFLEVEDTYDLFVFISLQLFLRYFLDVFWSTASSRVYVSTYLCIEFNWIRNIPNHL